MRTGVLATMDNYGDCSSERSLPGSGNTAPVRVGIPAPSPQASQRVGEQLRELRNAWNGAYGSQAGRSSQTQPSNESFSRTARPIQVYDPTTPPTQTEWDLQAQVQEMWQNIDMRQGFEMHQDMEIHAAGRTRPTQNLETESSGSDFSNSGTTTQPLQNSESLAQGNEAPGDSTARNLRRQSQNSDSVFSLPSFSSSLATTPSNESAPCLRPPTVIEPFSMPPPISSISEWPFLPPPIVSAEDHETNEGSIRRDRIQRDPGPQARNDEFQTVLATVISSPHLLFQDTHSHPLAPMPSPATRCRMGSDSTPLRSMLRDRERFRSSNSLRRSRYRRHTMPSLDYLARSLTPPSQHTRHRRPSQSLLSPISSSLTPQYARRRHSSPIYRPLSYRTRNLFFPPGSDLRPPTLPRFGAMFRSRGGRE